MSRSQKRTLFGVHSFTPYNIATREPYGQVDIIGESNFAVNGEVIVLNGGSSRWAWAIEDGNNTAELSLTFREKPDFLFEVLFGKSVTKNAPEAGGFVSTPLNISGTSVVDAATGIGTLGVKAGSEADLKFARYIAKAISATEVQIYAYTNIDFARGNDASYQSDDLAILASPVTIPNSPGTVDLPNLGLEITGGTAVAMVIGDTATFDVRPINTSSNNVKVGSLKDVYPEFGCYITAQKSGSGAIYAIDIYRAKAVGMPFGFGEKAFDESAITAQVRYDSAREGVFEFLDVTG